MEKYKGNTGSRIFSVDTVTVVYKAMYICIGLPKEDDDFSCKDAAQQVLLSVLNQATIINQTTFFQRKGP